MKNLVVGLTFLLTAITLIAVLNRPLTDEEFINQPGIVKHADPPSMYGTIDSLDTLK